MNMNMITTITKTIHKFKQEFYNTNLNILRFFVYGLKYAGRTKHGNEDVFFTFWPLFSEI